VRRKESHGIRRAIAAAGAVALLAALGVSVADPALAAPSYGGVRIVDAHGDPVAGADVTLTDANGTSVFGGTVADGTFHIENRWTGTPGVTSLSATILVNRSSLNPYKWDGTSILRPTLGTAPTSRAEFEASSGELLELALPYDQPDGSISGVVTLSPAPARLVTGDLSVSVNTPTGITVATRVPVSADGSYTVTGLEAGSYVLTFGMWSTCSLVSDGDVPRLCGAPAAPWGYAQQVYAGDVADDSGAVLVAADESVVGVDQQLRAAARLRGVMRYDASFGLPVVSLRPTGSGATSLDQRQSAAPYGVFVIDIAPGPYLAEFGWAGPYGFVGGSGLLDSPRHELNLAPGSVTNLVGPGAVTFSDVSTANLFWYEISWLAINKIATGYPDGTFGAWMPVTREAMAAFLYRAAGSPTFNPDWQESPFVDVPVTHQFYREISWLAYRGISTGYDRGDGTKEFRPGSPIARDAMAAFLFRSHLDLGYEPPADSRFADVSTTNQFYKEISWLAERGITTGYSDGTFRPSAFVNRDAMAAFLYRDQ
jgi:hypothetical protein